MNILIIGCSRTGVLLARRLQEAGHEVAVIDQDPARLKALSQEGWFEGPTCCGLPIDADTLTAGGIESSDAVFALTGDDTMNIMVAQIAQQQYHIRPVWAQIADPLLKDAYGRCFAIWTVCPGELTADALYQSFAARIGQQALVFGNNTVYFQQTEPPAGCVGGPLHAAAQALAGITVLGLVRESGEVALAGEDPRLQPGDRLLTAAAAPQLQLQLQHTQRCRKGERV